MNPNSNGWRPIITAPKDSTRILIWFGPGDAKYNKAPFTDGWEAAHEGCWIDQNKGVGTWNGLEGVALYWRPMPKPVPIHPDDPTEAQILAATKVNWEADIPQKDLIVEIWHAMNAADPVFSARPAQDLQSEGCNAVRDVLAERLRQISEEGWTPKHDDQHDDFSLAKAGSVYAALASVGSADRAVMDQFGLRGVPGKLQDIWPLSWDISWLKPKSRRRDLIKSAALIIAEIERLDRNRPEVCPVCAAPFDSGDICATDIELGTCHAECLADAPIVNLETGEPSDGPIATFGYDGGEVAK